MPPVLSRFRKLFILSESSPLLFENYFNKRQWSTEINLRREEQGEFHTLYKELKNSDQRFFEYLRMSKETFDKLLKKLEGRLRKMELNYRKSIEPEERLVVTLRYLGIGMSFRSLALAFHMGKSTVASIVADTTKAIWDLLKDEYLPIPDENKWIDIADKMYLKTNFPNCIGSIDCKHIRLKCPENSGSEYCNYKQYCLIILQAVVDPDFKFIAVDVVCKGRQIDGDVFRNSKLFELLETGKLNIPPPRELPNSETKIPFVLVGDEAYPLLPYLMRPFPRKSLNSSKHIFNYRLSTCRQQVEGAFKTVTAKWQILNKAIETTPDLAVAIVKATCVLHNFVINNDGIDKYSLNLDMNHKRGEKLITKCTNAYSITAKSIRNNLTQYFSSKEGKVSWQNDYTLPTNLLQNAS